MKQRQDNQTTLMHKEEVKRTWYIFDASGKTLGRFCSEVAKVLRGKHKPAYTPHIDMGDGVIVINANKIRVTGAKKAQKIYRYYTGYIGGLREIPYENMIERNPAYVIMNGVKGMLAKTRLTKRQMRRLRVYKGDEHNFSAQKPIRVEC